LVSVWFNCYAIYAAFCFFQNQHSIDSDFHPPVTIIKPVCGLDSNTCRNLTSFCQQDYPDYQIIFGFRDLDDPAIPTVKQIIHDFPHLDIELVICPRIIGANLKMSNVANASESAKHEILFVVDSDIRVGSDYLQQVIQPLQDPKVGVITCLYRSLVNHWTTSITAISTCTEFAAGVLVSNHLAKSLNYAFGQTIVIRKEVLTAIGGFEAIADYLADDFQLGYLPAEAGYKVVLSDYVVEHELTAISLTDAIAQKIRWVQCIRVSRPRGYLGLIFMYGTVISTLLLITTGASYLSWIIFGITWTTRLIMGWVVGVVTIQDQTAKKYLWLVPLSDLIGLIVWYCGFFSNTTKWRQDRFKLTKDGKLVAIADTF
jgi:ceramide glucosyltransferase